LLGHLVSSSENSSTGDQGNHEQHYKDDEQNSRDFGRCSSNTKKSQRARDKRYYEKY